MANAGIASDDFGRHDIFSEQSGLSLLIVIDRVEAARRMPINYTRESDLSHYSGRMKCFMILHIFLASLLFLDSNSVRPCNGRATVVRNKKCSKSRLIVT